MFNHGFVYNYKTTRNNFMIRAKIVGAGGYGGVGITELLHSHPEAEICALVDIADAGRRISDIYPHLKGFCDIEILAPDHALAQEPADVVFFSTPDRVGMQLAAAELAKGAKVIDYSGDFRFDSAAAYAEYAARIGLDTSHASPELLNDTVYGVAELHRADINPERRLLGNAGCFAISCILGLSPAVAAGVIELDSIICDCKTGVSGAGKKAAPAFHYPARYDNMNAYKLSGHQHVCEIERELGLLAEEDVKITFTTQIVPVCRGILSSLYATLKEPLSAAQLMEIYSDFNRDNGFIRVYDSNSGIGTVHVRGTNFCNLVVDVDERTRRMRVFSHIDNLVKGQAGNALQNMNLLFGLPENMGLDRPAQYP
jgi:N-acetyl-gamma-glutamyl-phosphate reductase